ncbi:hypothetical protein B296_00058444, partial [Ensete ventricosum]
KLPRWCVYLCSPSGLVTVGNGRTTTFREGIVASKWVEVEVEVEVEEEKITMKQMERGIDKGGVNFAGGEGHDEADGRRN